MIEPDLFRFVCALEEDDLFVLYSHVRAVAKTVRPSLNHLDEIAADYGWLPLIPKERMIIRLEDLEYEVRRLR